MNSRTGGFFATRAIRDWPDEIIEFIFFIANFKIFKNRSHFWGDGPEIGSQMSCRALEPRPDISRTRRIQPRQRESPKRDINDPNGPVSGPYFFKYFLVESQFSYKLLRENADFARPARACSSCGSRRTRRARSTPRSST